MEKRKLSLVLFTVLLSLPVVSANSFGTYPVEIEKQTSDLEVEYRMGFVNPSNTTWELEFSSPSSPEYDVEFPENAVIQPGEVTENPESSGWYSLPDGKYASTVEKSFRVNISRYRLSNRIDIPVTVTARPSGETGRGNRIVQVRSYRFRAIVEPSLRPQERPEDAEDSWEVRFWDEADTSEPPGETEGNQQTSEEPGNESSNSAKTYKASGTDQNTGEEGIDRLTYLFIAGIVASVAYIYKVL